MLKDASVASAGPQISLQMMQLLHNVESFCYTDLNLHMLQLQLATIKHNFLGCRQNALWLQYVWFVTNDLPKILAGSYTTTPGVCLFLLALLSVFLQNFPPGVLVYHLLRPVFTKLYVRYSCIRLTVSVLSQNVLYNLVAILRI